MYVIRERLFRLGEDSDITDEAEQPVLHVDGKVLSLHNRLILRDPAGREVGQVHRKLAALRPTHEFTLDQDDQTVATISKRWLRATASYAVEVAPGENDLLILASVLALDLAI